MDSLNSFVEFVGAISPVVFFLSLLFLLFGFYKIRTSHKETPRDVRATPEILREDMRAMPEILRDVRATQEKLRDVRATQEKLRDALGAPEKLRDVRAGKLPVLRKKSTLRKVVEFMGNVELD
jgi:hypothetical protein